MENSRNFDLNMMYVIPTGSGLIETGPHDINSRVVGKFRDRYAIIPDSYHKRR